MFKSKTFIVFILGVLLLFIIPIISFSQELPKIAVVAITSTAEGCSYRSNSPLSIAITDLMINALVRSNRFRVFERAKLDAILQEQNFQNFSGLVDQSTAVKLGKMIGVGIIVTGTINDVSFRKGIGFQIGPIKVKKSSVEVSMTIKFIDVTTGEILYSAFQQSKDSSSAVTANLPIPIPGGVGISEKNAANILSAVEVICDCVVTAFVQKTDGKIARIEAAPLEGYIVKVISTSSGNLTQIYINLGKNTTIKEGDKIRIYREGEVIRDPKTNEVLDRELKAIAMGTVRLVKDKLSKALITEKLTNEEIMEEDIVKIIR